MKYYCVCEADCIHKQGIVTKRVNGKTRKFDGCGNKSRKCNCQHRRRYE